MATRHAGPGASPHGETEPDLAPVADAEHLSPDEFDALLGGHLGEHDSRRLSAHVGGCRRCAQALADREGATVQRDPLLGSTVGDFRVERFLSSGGMGAVYVAAAPDGARVALKVLLGNVAGDPQFAARMRAEARALASVRHPNVVGVRGAGELGDGRTWLAMEFVEGETLTRRMVLQSFNPRGATTLLDQLLAGLEACHALGVLHRDLKPDNLLVRDTPEGPEVVLIDFGLARQRDATAITQADALVGSLGFLAPEVLRGEPLTLAADLYAVGCIAWKLLTREPLFPPAAPMELIRSHLQDPVPRLRDLVPEAPAALERWVERLLEKDPAARYASAREARTALGVVRQAMLYAAELEFDDQALTDPMVTMPTQDTHDEE